MRTKIYALILMIFMTFLICGIAHIQLGMHSRYKVMSEDNRLKIVPLMAPRGTIYDNSGRPLVKDVLSFNAAVIYNRIKDREALARMLSTVLGVDKDMVVGNINRSRRQPYSPVGVVPDIGIEKAVHMEEVGADYPGLLLEVSTKREYIYGKSASNVLGYLGSINRSEFDRLKHYGYRINDQMGRDGVEKQYDEYLRGKHGGKQVEVDHKGREAATLGFKEPVPGKDVYLTINTELQQYCDSLLAGKKGSIVVMDPETGALIAISSAPSYDPGVFVDRASRKDELNAVLRDKDYPLLNRTISGAYPPGSIFKVIVSVAALETKNITLNTSFLCNGSITLGGRAFHCWKKSGHGEQVLLDAIQNSCNVFFWRVGLLLGVDNIAEYAKKFGVGQKTGIDLPGEVRGILPTQEWKKNVFNEKWYKGETLNYAVGQGYLLCSPIQLARIMSVFANKGYMVRPYVVSKVGEINVNIKEKELMDVSPNSINVVREGLRRVVNEPRGTGVKARLDNVIVSGKTGTAQTSRGKSHGWFAGFAPFENAKITIVIFDEYGGKGGYFAAQTAGKVLKKAEELGLL